ncbi:MAG: AMP-binding protein, partial [Anaerolineales bacterium]|nr:AMP-binding protein [Anaerolineales bacterium]
MLHLQTRPNFHTLLDAVTLQTADERPALIYIEIDVEPLMISRAAFKEAAEQYAAALEALGIKVGDLVIIAHTQNLESIYAFWGCLLLGAIPSMFPTLTEKLDPTIYRQHMAELVRLSDVRAIFTTADFAPTLATAVTCPIFTPPQLNQAHSKIQNPKSKMSLNAPLRPQNPESIAFLQHSSGTTGLQKGVALSHTAVLNQLASYTEAVGLTSEDVIVSWLPLYHDMGLIAGFLLPLLQGIPLVLMSPFDWVRHPALLFKAISQFEGTLCWLPNFAYNHCGRRIRQRDLEGITLRSMRAFINCSEPVRADSHQLFVNKFAALGVTPEMLTVSYAMAENTFAVTQTPIGRAPTLDQVDLEQLNINRTAQPATAETSQAAVHVSCGRPIYGTQVKVIDDTGQELTERQVGELLVQSNCMLSEYYKRPDLEPFTEGWYKTGDMGYIADGEVYIVGRRKDLIINAGKNV